MKNYYSLLCPSPEQSLIRSLAEPFFVVGCVGAFCAVLWFTGPASHHGARQEGALAQSRTH